MSSQHVSKLELSANIPLGEGGFGTVLKVRNQETKVEYALKQVDFKPDEWEATIMEANIHSRLSHRNVVGYFGHWTSKNDLRMFNQLWGNLVYTPEEEQESSSEESQPQEDIEYLYLLLEACDENMFQRLEKIITADIDVTTVKHKLWVVLTLKDISEGLRYLHSKGVMHRDLKPENILFIQNVAKICDFGLAKMVGGAASGSSLDPGGSAQAIVSKHTPDVGTRMYMSPEQRRGHSYDHKTDIYPFGLIYYKMIFPSTTDMEVARIRDVLPDQFEPCSMFRLFRDMMSLEPNNRPGADDIIRRCDEIILELNNMFSMSGVRIQ